MITKSVLSYQSSEESIGIRAFDPIIATALGDERLATIVQQVYRMVQSGLGEVEDGVHWVFNSYPAWQKEFPWLSKWKVRTALEKLREMGILLFKKRRKANCNHTGHYAINEDLLKQLVAEAHASLASHRCAKNHTSKSGISQIDVLSVLTSDPRSLITKNQDSKTLAEYNSTSAAEICKGEEVLLEEVSQEEESNNTLLFAEIQENTSTQESDLKPDLKEARPARYHNNLEVLKAYGFELTKQLEKLAQKYSEKQIERGLSHLEVSKELGQEINKELGWLTEALKNNWWLKTITDREKRLVEKALDDQGLDTDVLPEDFFQTLAKLIDEGIICDMDLADEDIQLGKYVVYEDDEFFVALTTQNNDPDSDQVFFTSWEVAVRLLPKVE